jgi:hypothetical protein
MIAKKFHQVLSLLLIIGAIYVGFYTQLPSKDKEMVHQNMSFSSEKALHHLKEISKYPHFPGVAAHDSVRNYIKTELEKLGLAVEIQEQVAVNLKWRAATTTKNIVARVKGSGNGSALLLLSHYDSNPHSSLGASDAGSGVVVILEGIRAFLEQNISPINDIIICITDAEELGLLGANAFVNHHRWAKDVKLVLNFEARGSGGPSYMLLETNSGNKKLIEAFKQTKAPYPIANSLMYSIYKMLPNDTDLTVFREDGNIDGFNFAFIGDHFDYHTVQDSFERMDIKSFNHQVTYLLYGLDYFANNSLENLKSEQDFVYFSFPYVGLVYYPFSWVTPMVIVLGLVFIVLLFLGVLKSRLSPVGILKGFFPFFLSLVLSGLFAFYGWQLMLKIYPQYTQILHGFTYNGYVYIAAFAATSMAFCFFIYSHFFKKNSLPNLIVAPLTFWLLLNLGIALFLKGAGFFILPVILMLIYLSVFIFSNPKSKNTLFFTIVALPVLLVFPPLIKMLPVGLGLKMLFVSTLFLALIFGVLIPVFKQYTYLKKMGYLFLAIGVLAFASASFQSSFSEERKLPNSILYALNADTNQAYWATYNTIIDDFTKQFLGDNPLAGSYNSGTTASKYKTKLKWHAKAPLVDLMKPRIEVVSDTVVNSKRIVCLQIESLRNANRIELLANKPIQFHSFSVNGEFLKNNTGFSVEFGTIMSYYRTQKDDLLQIEFETSISQKFDITVVEAKYDLFTNPQFSITPRANYMMPMPFVLNDASIITTQLKF